MKDGILKLQNVELIDFNKNNFKIKTAFLNTLSNQLIGQDISIDLDNKSFNKDNEPRIKGKVLSIIMVLQRFQRVFSQLVKRQINVLHGSCQLKKLHTTLKKK